MKADAAKDRFIEIPVSKRSIANRKLVYGVGINDADYQISQIINGKQFYCDYYDTWRRMLKRCYLPNHRCPQQSHVNCSVEKEWHRFSSFKSWMKKQNWQDKVLDKNVLKHNNKIYSKESCIFVTSTVNNILNDRGNTGVKYPKGVSMNNDRFRARCNVNRESRHIGYFDTPEEAHDAYKTFKRELIIKTANEQTDSRVKAGLLLHAELL